MKRNAEKVLTAPLAISLLALSIAAAGQAQAQSGREAGPALEEIVVTAEHRRATLQETEISITALSADTIEDLGITNGSDLGQYIPNVYTQALPGSALGFNPVIRGVGQGEVFVTYDPAAGLYIDDVLIPKNPGALIDILDMERIEVLRGPQGTLYGRNTIAGAMNFITRKPADELEGSLRITAGTKNQRDYRGILNVPLLPADSDIGALNLRVTAASLNRDGLVQNRLPGAPTREFGTKDRDVVMAHLQWEPTESLQMRYTYDRTRIDEVPEIQYVTIINPDHPVGLMVAPYAERQTRRPSTTLSDGEMRARLDVDGHALNIAYDISDNMTLRSITGYREMKSGGINEDNVPFPLINTADEQYLESFTQEFRLTGSALDDRLDYSLGAFYMKEEGEAGFRLLVFGAPLSDSYGEFENSNWALYGQATYAVTDRWSLTGGLRYTEEKREMNKEELLLPAVVYPRASRNFDNVSPMVSVGYQWNESINSYFKVSSGYQSGGFNVRDIDVNAFAQGFDEEKLLSYELGVKATSADQRFRTNIALWFSDYRDKRVNNFIPEIASNVIRNAGEVEMYGLELEFLASLTDNLLLGLDYGYIKPKYTKYDDGAGNDLSNVTNFPLTPKNNVHAFVNYTVPGVSLGVATARLDYSYRDGIRFLGPQPERNSGRSLGLVNARLTLDEIAGPGNTAIRVSAWVKNLTDESYWTGGANVFSTFGFDINNYGDPRLFGMDFELKF